MNINNEFRRVKELFISKIIDSKNDDFVDLSSLKSTSINTVIYVGSEGDETIRNVIYKNLEPLSKTFQKLGYQFIFYPALKGEESIVGERLSNALAYSFPEWSGLEDEVAKQINAIDVEEFYSCARQTYGLDSTRSLLLFVESHETKVTHYPVNSSEQLNKTLDTVVSNIEHEQNLKRKRISSLSFYDPDRFRENNDTAETKRYDADGAFSEDSSKISRDVAEQIQTLLSTGQSKALLNIYSNLLKQTKLQRPELFKEFRELTNTKTEVSLSRLLVDEHYRIWLTDYNNLEIVMTPLPKTLFLFFLKRPEGIMLHDLVDHKKELLSLYECVTKSSCSSEIRKRIDDMTDMRKNSLNEKCSRIKEAFVRKMDDSVAKNYYITGERGECKRIKLPINLTNF